MAAAPLRMQSLLSDIAAGRADAVDQLLRRHASAVWGLARRYCRSVQDAEDATQEIFVELWRTAERFDPACGSEQTFVLTIARRRLIDRMRRQGRRPQPALLDDADAITTEEPMAVVAQRDEVARAQAAMADLRPEQREVLDLALGEGRTHQEIAMAIGIPLGTVKSHARRGLMRLRELLGVPTGDPAAPAAGAPADDGPT